LFVQIVDLGDKTFPLLEQHLLQGILNTPVLKLPSNSVSNHNLERAKNHLCNTDDHDQHYFSNPKAAKDIN
jgi:hypothetical protein